MAEKQKETKKKTKPTEVAELKELLQRTQASFENYRKQAEKRIEDIKSVAAKDVLVQLLPVVDNFELALQNVGKSSTEDLVKGIQLIHSQLHTILEGVGVVQIKTDGTQFNPHQHEALMKEASDKAENVIIETFQQGYMLGEMVLRPARVKVSAGTNDNSEDKND